MPFHFSEHIVAITFYHNHQSDHPDLQDLKDWDTSLRNSWRTVLNQVIPEFPGIDGTNKEVRSTIMMLARFATNQGSRKDMARAACTYYLHVTDLGLIPDEDEDEDEDES